MGVPSRELSLVLLLASVAACGDPDQYFRHAKDDAGTLPVLTGGTGGGPSMSGVAGAGGSPSQASGGAGASAAAGAAGTTAGATAGSSAAGAAGAGTGVAGAPDTQGTAGGAGVGSAAGGAAGATTCPGCKIEVVYACLANGSDSRNFAVEAKNAGSTLVLFRELTLRYWYTADPTKAQELDCDTAQNLTCQYLVSSMDTPPAPQPKFVPVTPARTMANEYAEIAFVQGAMDVGGTTGRIQLRLHNKDFSPIDQTQDYSADCGSIGQAHDSPKITAYIGGVLVGGTEPQ
jgi:hypothetical protein